MPGSSVQGLLQVSPEAFVTGNHSPSEFCELGIVGIKFVKSALDSSEGYSL